MTIDASSFKLSMRQLAGHVCLITTITPSGERQGLTATAVCSVSADPPTLLCCVNRGSISHAAIRDAKLFAVNVLALEDKALADRFAKPISGEEKFEHGMWTQLLTGAPILKSASAALDCRLSQVIDVATHGILVGEIQAVSIRQHGVKPLLYTSGGYGGFAPLEIASA